MRRTFFIILCVCTAFLLCACAGKDGDKSVNVPHGYSCEDVTGGKPAKNVNIKNVKVEEDGAFTGLTVEFSYGSDLAGSGEVSGSVIPKYTVGRQTSPYALTLYTEGIAYSDFEITGKHEYSGNLLGMFFDAKTSKLYFQFSKDMAFNVREEKSSIVISAVPLQAQQGVDEYAYYVTSNTYDSYSCGVSDFSQMIPTLTRSGEKILISGEFAKEKDAKDYLQKLSEEYPLYSRSFEVIAKYYNELPIYNPLRDNARVYAEPILRQDGKTQVGDVFVSDGFYLATTQDGVLYEKFVNGHSEVYIKSGDERSRYLNFEFENIEKVEYAPDGRRLAILENSSAGSHLYVFDVISTELLYDLSDSGFGKRISNFIWNEPGTALYAISGDDRITVRMYDFAINDETKRTSTVYDGETDEGSLTLHDGHLYFASTDDKGSRIYSLRPETGVKSEFCAGSGIEFCGKYAAVTTASLVASNDTYSFYVINTDTDKKVIVTDKFAVYDFVWSDDGEYLYYVENRHSGTDSESGETSQPKDDYPYTLYRYSTKTEKSEKLYDIRYYNRLEAYGKDLLLMHYDSSVGIPLFAGTYVIK